MSYTTEDLIEAVRESHSFSEACRKVGEADGGNSRRKVIRTIKEQGLATSHFDKGYAKRAEYPLVSKACPICYTKFVAKKGHPKEKATCSYGCANIFFRSGKDNGNYKNGLSATGWKVEYRAICFSNYEYKCLLCSWDKVVEVHHLDGNHSNNSSDNLIPLCPNHHRLSIMNKYKEGLSVEIAEVLDNIRV